MEFLTGLLANDQVQTGILTIFGILLTWIMNRAVGAFQAATGIRIEEKHQRALHQGILTAVESALQGNAGQSGQMLRAHVMNHLRESVPDALTALTPGDGVLDRLIERYSREAMAKIGQQTSTK
jgi:hypothetical protein